MKKKSLIKQTAGRVAAGILTAAMVLTQVPTGLMTVLADEEPVNTAVTAPADLSNEDDDATAGGATETDRDGAPADETDPTVAAGNTEPGTDDTQLRTPEEQPASDDSVSADSLNETSASDTDETTGDEADDTNGEAEELKLLWSPMDDSALENQFALAVVTDETVVIAPTLISFENEMTAAQALLATDHTFTGLANGEFITAVDDVAGSYVLAYTEGGYDLEASAAGVKGLFMTTDTAFVYDDMVRDLVIEMALFNSRTDGRIEDALCRSAYEAALDGLYGIDKTKAGEKLLALQTAEKDYEDYMSGNSFAVDFALTLNDSPVTPAYIEATDSRGGVTRGDNVNTLNLKKGSYTYVTTDGNGRFIRGSFTVEAATRVSAAFQEQLWIDKVSLGTASQWAAGDAVASRALPEGSTDKGAIYVVPDHAGPNLYPYIEPTAGTPTTGTGAVSVFFGNSTARAWKSRSTSLVSAIVQDNLADRDVVLEARYKTNPHEAEQYEQYEEWHLQIHRAPTLTNLEISDAINPLIMVRDDESLGFDRTARRYRVTTTERLVNLNIAMPTGAQAKIGKTVIRNNLAEVPLVGFMKNDNEAEIPLDVYLPDGETTTYTICVTVLEPAYVCITGVDTLTWEVRDAAGQVMQPTDQEMGIYTLHAGESYTLDCLAETYFHCRQTFTAENNLALTAAYPETVSHLKELSARQSSGVAASAYAMMPTFKKDVHEYDIKVGSTVAVFYLKALADSGYKVEAIWKNLGTGKMTTLKLNTGYANLANVVRQSGLTSPITLRVTKEAVENGLEQYQEYLLTASRLMQLSTLKVKNGEKEIQMAARDEAGTAGFVKTTLDYEVKVSDKTTALALDVTPLTSINGNDNAMTVTCENTGEVLTYDETHLPHQVRTLEVALDPTKSEETLILTVGHSDPLATTQRYTVLVKKLPAVKTTVSVSPAEADAVVFMESDDEKLHILPGEDGFYELDASRSYTCTVTAPGYIAATQTFVASDKTTAITFTLEKAAESSFKDISGEKDWPSFRGGGDNNTVIDAPSMTEADKTMLLWANQIGEGYSSGAVGCPIIVGDYLYTYAGKSIVKVDKRTGEVVASGLMAASSSFAINAPTYAAGMIFVGLSNGRLQAFNAETLTPLWLYTDARGGQPNCELTYRNGYLYTGFWNSESGKPAHYVAIDVTDEYPDRPDEEKKATWTYTDNGFYWAGAYATDRFLLVTTDDGEAGYTTGHGSVVSLDPKTGAVIDKVTATGVGDLRSSVCYDKVTNAYYFTSKGGHFYQIRVNEDGTFVPDSMRSITLSNGSGNPQTPAMSTSTPVIHNGRAYVGVSGTSQFTPYTGHNITVIDLASWQIAYSVPTQGYPQTSGVVTTAYEAATEYVYVYFFDNYTPGKLRVIRDKAGQTEMDHTYSTMETYTSGGVTKTYETGYVLFTPHGAQAQYAICSPIMDSEGNIYFKNDSGYMMCLTNTIDKLQLDEKPTRTNYCIGTQFDPKGMTLSAITGTGIKTDITAYAGYTTEPLTADDTEITLTYDLAKLQTGEKGFWALYQNKDGEAGVPVDLPTVSLDITLQEHADKNRDGKCDNCGTPMEVKEKLFSLAGDSRYTTAAKVAATAFPAGSEPSCAVLVTGANFPDALSANALAGSLDCPLIMTNLTKLADATADLLKNTWGGSVKTVYVVGGGFSDAVFNSLKACGVTKVDSNTYKGKDRYDTAEKVCKGYLAMGGSKDSVIVATGLTPADALSISSWSYRYQIPILLANKYGDLRDSSKALLKQFGHVYIVGAESCCRMEALTGAGIVPDKITRLAGSNRYETSAAIATYFLDKYPGRTGNVSRVVMAKGANANYPDALVGGMLAGRGDGAPVILVGAGTSSDVTYKLMRERIKNSEGPGYILGAAAQDTAIVNKIRASAD
ncbi:MAG: cell wall-binding repeat-containing protein [Lachnospiraceae bacterium]|nr:cell wall-binding repeat-containing protein [Lachnospiraceae bacterium]